MGSPLQLADELLPLFSGVASRVNNVERGKKGRWRSNLWPEGRLRCPRRG
jgi:hypothetical protein